MVIPFNEACQKMLEASKLKNMTALAGVFGITPQALSNYKKRGEMPAHLVIQFAKIHGCSLDWLVFGTEPVERKVSAIESPAITPEEGVAVFQMLKLMKSGGVLSLTIRNMLDALYSEHIKEEARLCKSA